jgi:arylsulfatase A-like enzyme
MRDDRRNVVLVTADSIRADYCGFLGGPNTTPFLSNTSLGAVVFENAVAPGPRTPSSVPVAMTGEWYRTPAGDPPRNRLSLIADHLRRFRTTGERLQERGYATAAITANPWTTTATGFDRVFDEFREIGGGYGDDGERTFMEKLLDYADQWRKSTDWFAQWKNYYDDISERLERLDEPWFLWVFLLDTHSPYIVPSQYRRESTRLSMYYSVLRYNLSVMRGNPDVKLSPRVHEWTRRAYRDSIRSIDAFLERLSSDVDLKRTSVVFHSDHGDAMREHGMYGHQDQMYEENLRVPMAVLPADESRRIAEPVSLIKLPEVIADTARGRLDPDSYVSPFSYSRTEFGEVDAVRGERFKLISGTDWEELYDLETDPGERTNRIEDLPEVAEPLRACLRSQRQNIRNRRDIVQAVRDVVETGS